MLKTILALFIVAFATCEADRLGSSLVAAYDGDVNKAHEGGLQIHEVKSKMTSSLNDAIKIVSFDSALDIAAIRQKIDDNMQALTGAFHAGSGGLGVDSFLCGKVTPGQWAASARS